MHRTRIALCYGTGPQVIKASVLRSCLESRYTVVAVDTGQCCDYALDAAGIEPHFGHGLSIVPPVGALESLALARAAEMVFTDSGGLQREAYWMGTPCVTLRRDTERIETVEQGANIPLDPAGGAAELTRAIVEQRRRRSNGGAWTRTAHGAGDAAQRIVSAIGTLVR
jgi:UDP-N-acetylglucosamine 2-epimerase